jgi:murein DD-endopeptidase MepM/ murein hydrolase activator NlpD
MHGLMEDAPLGVPSPLVELRDKIVAFFDRLFVDREIFIRGRGKVVYVTLSRQVQAIALACAAGLLAFLTLSGGGLMWQSQKLDSQQAEIDQAKAAYAGLMGEVGRYQQQFTEISRELDESQALMQGLSAFGPEEETAQLVSEGLKRAGDARIALETKLAEFEMDVNKIVGRNISLNGQLVMLKSVLEDNRHIQEVIESQRQGLKLELENSAEKFNRLKGKNKALAVKLTTLEDSLRESNGRIRALTTERDALSDELGVLTDRFAKHDARESELLGRIAMLSAQSDQVRAAHENLLDERESLVGRADTAETRLGQLQRAQTVLFARLRERTELTVASIEQTLATTGLDVDQLIARVAKDTPGSGGPFVPAAPTRDGHDGVLQVASTSPVALFDFHMTRWEAMQRLLEAMPLTPPLDHFWVSSKFGKRKDPVNGRVALHAGIDLSAQPGTRVMSTSPGRVTFAGWKGNYGRFIEIDHGYGLKTRYAHLRRIDVEVGQEVGHREVIGLLGNSGRSTGPHVHYEIVLDGKPQDPMNFLKAGRHVFKG